MAENTKNFHLRNATLQTIDRGEAPAGGRCKLADEIWWSIGDEESESGIEERERVPKCGTEEEDGMMITYGLGGRRQQEGNDDNSAKQ